MWRPAVAPGVAALALLATAVVVPVARAEAPNDPRCLGLAAGSTGLLAVGGSVPTPDTLARRRGGFGAPAPAEIARTLPDAVAFRTRIESFSQEYAFALRRGRIYVRPATLGRGAPGEPWRELELPECLRGNVTELSADKRLLLALGDDRQLYSHDMPGGDLSAERWTWRWGPYFWSGAGMRMFADVADWAASEFTSSERFVDASGRERTAIGVATVYLLRGDARRITYLDPWLPGDESREVCGPRRGTLPLAGLSGSGSTVFVAGRRGELYTRVYDFDVSGANTVFGDYSWQQERPASDPRWQLPGPGWVRHARPGGARSRAGRRARARITDRLTILTTGPTTAHRVLRVEGRDNRGRAGYWEKPIAQAGPGAWRFVRMGAPLAGRLLPRPGRRAFFAPNDRRYAGRIAGAPAAVLDFNPECSPATLRVEVAPGAVLDLLLHSSDGLRQETRARGLDDTPREYNGAIEVPRGAFDRLGERDPRKAWIDAHLGGRRIATAPLAVTATRMRFLAQCWELTLGGAPARADAPRVPPDLGAAFARLTEQQKDGREPPNC